MMLAVVTPETSRAHLAGAETGVATAADGVDGLDSDGAGLDPRAVGVSVMVDAIVAVIGLAGIPDSDTCYGTWRLHSDLQFTQACRHAL